MQKSTLDIICSILCGIILIVASILAGYQISLSLAILIIAATGSLGVLGTFQTPRKYLFHIFCELDWAEEVQKIYYHIPSLYRKSFWITFGFVNLAFLFHTINFMWGNRDWHAVRFDVDVNESLQYGRFSAYWLQEILFNGKILPVINNLWAFAGLSLAGVQLCIYWKLPRKVMTYVIVALFFVVTPYTLSWLYFAKNTLGNLWVPAFILSALILSDKSTNATCKLYINNLFSVLFLIIALGTYLPSIQFLGIAFLGKILLKTITSEMTIKSALKEELQTVVNLLAAGVTFGFIITLLKLCDIVPEIYNTQLSGLADALHKIPTMLTVSLSQFVQPYPFIDNCWQYLMLIMFISSIFALILLSPNAKASGRGLIMIPLILITSRLTYLLSIPSDENPLYLSRIDFYAVPLIYALALSIILKLGTDRLKKAGYIFACLLIFMSFVRVSYAQKVWKFGWDAETKLAERIITRMEKDPNFDINRQYKLLQIGEKSLRSKYYIKRNNETTSGELLSWSYYPEDNSKDAYNFYYQVDFLSADADKTLAYQNPKIRQYLQNEARPWPDKASIRIIDDYIIFIMDERALIKTQNQLENIR